MTECLHQCLDHAGQKTRIDALEKEIILRFSDLERRLGGLNALRTEVVQDRQQFLRADTYMIKTDFYDRWIATVERRLTVIETRSVTWTAALGVLFLLVQLALHWLRL